MIGKMARRWNDSYGTGNSGSAGSGRANPYGTVNVDEALSRTGTTKKPQILLGDIVNEIRKYNGSIILRTNSNSQAVGPDDWDSLASLAGTPILDYDVNISGPLAGLVEKSKFNKAVYLLQQAAHLENDTGKKQGYGHIGAMIAEYVNQKTPVNEDRIFITNLSLLKKYANGLE